MQITIPAEYLEDVRSALVSEINQDSDALQVNQASLLEKNGELNREDRDASVRWLRNDLQLLDQLLDGSEARKVTADRDALIEVLQAMVRVLAGRLTDVCEYAPVPLGDVVELSARLRWAADEAIRLHPGLAERPSDGKAVA
jgi:hypothetical protein